MKKNLLLLKGFLELEKPKFINTKPKPKFMKNVYIDKLNNIVNKYINADHRTIQMKPIDVNDNIYILTLVKTEMIKILNFRLMIM